MVFNLDVGTGFILIIVIVIAFSLLGGWTAYGYIVRDECVRQINDKMSLWVENMKAPEALRGEESDWIKIGRECVDHVGKNYIKFRGSDEKVYYKLNSNRVVQFEFTGEILKSRDAPYKVRIDEKRGAIVFVEVPE
jgi:hypothetical protein